MIAFAFFADKTATDRVINLRVDNTAMSGKCRESHSVRVSGERLRRAEYEIAWLIEIDRLPMQQAQLSGVSDFSYQQIDLFGINLIRRFTEQSEDHRAIGRVAASSQRKRAEKLGAQARCLWKAAAGKDARHKVSGRSHGANGMRTGWPNPDLKNLKNAGFHVDYFVTNIVGQGRMRGRLLPGTTAKRRDSCVICSLVLSLNTLLGHS